MKNTFTLSIAAFILLTTACNLNKRFDSHAVQIDSHEELNTVVVKPHANEAMEPYQGMPTQYTDLIHTRLDIAFNEPENLVNARANLLLKAYARSINQIELDAKGFDIHRVSERFGKDTIDLKYSYDALKLKIELKKTLTAKDTVLIYIDYTAKPSQLKSNGGKAIRDNKGLYFINSKGTDPHKPRQIWTQGETENSSCWFPTIDRPSEKHTHDFYLYIPQQSTSLSNGLLVESISLPGKMKIDHWRQTLPHAPYLAMLAIGNFMVTKESWNGMEVSYYLEPEFHPHAKVIFGETPNMLTCFSQRTGVSYPWEKFSQVVARDFVSGAMENTSAVVHHEGVQHSAREHRDHPQEDIIAHELFHHWFGDYVTARSWGQIPLNESFANYGEYIWNEYRHGKDEADCYFERGRTAYLNSKSKHHTPAIRTHFNDPDEMFDVLSYQKGGRVLHQLRNYLGDTLFFRGIQLYLTQNAFGIADIHDLRKAFEKASGEDLNWYFNQWMIGFGHPDLLVDYQYNTSKNELQVKVKQRQDASIGVFKIPTTIAYGRDSLHKTIVPVVFDSAEQTFSFPVAASEMAYVSIDEAGVLLAEIEEHKSPAQWANQMKWAGSYGNFLRAYNQFKDSKDSLFWAYLPELIDKYLVNPNWVYQQYGLALLDKQISLIQQRSQQITSLALNHPKSKFRCEALQVMSYLKDAAIPTLQAALKDSSYLVNARALVILNGIQPELALNAAQSMEQVYSGDVQEAVSSIYANAVSAQRLRYFALVLGKFRNKRFSVLNNYGKYLSKHLLEDGFDGLQILKNYGMQSSDKDIHYRVDKILQQLSKQLEELNKQGKITENGYNTLKASIKNIQDWAKSGLEG